MRVKHLILFFLLFHLNGFCNQKVDSLLNISKQQIGEEFLNTYLQIAEEFAYGQNGDTTIYYSKICYTKALVLKDSTAILKAGLFLGNGYFLNHNYKKSETQSRSSILLAKQLRDEKMVLQTQYLLARSYQKQAHYINAIEEFKNAYDTSYKLVKKNKDKQAISYCKSTLTQLAYVYKNQGITKEGILFFHKLIKENPNALDEIKRSYYANIAFLYENGININKAELFLLKALEISKNTKNKNDLYQDYAYLGVLYGNNSQYDNAIAYYKQALEIAKEQNNTNKIAGILNCLGQAYEKEGNLKQGVKILYESLRFFSNKKDTTNLARTYRYLGILMTKWHNFEDAKLYVKKGLDIHKKLNQPIEITADYLGLIFAHIHNQESDSAKYYLKQTKLVINQTKNERQEGYYLLYTGATQLLFDSLPTKALHSLKRSLKIAQKIKSNPLTIRSNKLIGECYFEMDSLKQAKSFLLVAWNNCKSIRMLTDQAEIAQKLSQLYKNNSLIDSAYYYLEKSDRIKTKINQRNAIVALYKKDNDFILELVKDEKELLANENKRLFNKIDNNRIFYITLSIVLLSLFYILFKKKNRLLKEKIIEKELKEENITKKHNENKTALNKASLLVNAKNEAIKKLQKELEKQQSNTSKIHDTKEVKQLVNSKLTTEDDWDRYLQIFNQKKPHFLPYLKNRYPKLSRNEIKIFTLIKLDFNTREMSNILMVSPSSLNTARYRLRKKLKLKPEEKLEDIVNDLIKKYKQEYN